MRRHRQRRRAGDRIARIDVSPGVLAALVAYGWLGPAELGDREKIAAAIGDLLECWAENRLVNHLVRYVVTLENFPSRQDSACPPNKSAAAEDQNTNADQS